MVNIVSQLCCRSLSAYVSLTLQQFQYNIHIIYIKCLLKFYVYRYAIFFATIYLILLLILFTYLSYVVTTCIIIYYNI